MKYFLFYFMTNPLLLIQDIALKPWYLSWWAYGFYLIILGLSIFAVDRVQRARLIKRERRRAELLSFIARDLTASLDSDIIFDKLYENVNKLLDATVFGVGIYHPKRQEIEYRLAIERGKKYEPYFRDMKNKNQFPVWCIENRKPVFINDVELEYIKYLDQFDSANAEGAELEGGEKPEEPLSLIYLPLIAKDEVLGIITIQSFKKNAYKNYHLAIMQNLAAFTTIALDNAEAYRQLNEVRAHLEATVKERTTEIQIQKESIERLSEIGKEITASLDMDTIFYKLYEHVNQLADATIFGVGIYHPDGQEIEYRLAIERGKKYEPYFRDMKNKNQFPVWCIENRKPVFINDVDREYKNYISEYHATGSTRTLEDGTIAKDPVSIIYLPLIAHEKVLGVISIQSFNKDAYTEYHLNILENLAAYTTIALDNANAYRQLTATLDNLKATQDQLIVQEKLASLGQLTAGIAHEIKNPLNFINNFAQLLVKFSNELKEDLKLIKDDDLKKTQENLNKIVQLSEKINEHGKRADSIVHNMMNHARSGNAELVITDLNALLDESANLVYHGMRAKHPGFNIKIEKDFEADLKPIKIIAQDVSRVFLNIIGNACYAANKQAKDLDKNEKSGDEKFNPTVNLTTKDFQNRVEIYIRDNGHGISKEIQGKIFSPFFTTKPTGEGTGLGLSISYDTIVKAHSGKLIVESEEGVYTEFKIILPRT